MNSLYLILTLLAQMAPFIKQLIIGAESSGEVGVEKKARVMAGVRKMFEGSQTVAGDKTIVHKLDYGTQVEPMVDIAVEALVGSLYGGKNKK